MHDTYRLYAPFAKGQQYLFAFIDNLAIQG